MRGMYAWQMCWFKAILHEVFGPICMQYQFHKKNWIVNLTQTATANRKNCLPSLKII